MFGLLKSGTVQLRRTIRSGKLDRTSWNAVQQICPHRGDAFLNYQEGTDSETFVMGSDAAEFVNKVKGSSAKKTE